jgi:hypothetical protein
MGDDDDLLPGGVAKVIMRQRFMFRLTDRKGSYL